MLLLDSTLWIVTVSALVAAAGALLLAGLVWYLVSRSRRGQTGQLERLLEASNDRFEEMLGDLARDLERARDETRRSRQLAAIGATIDLDTVLSRALEAAAELTLVDAAMIVVPQEDAGPVIATYGLSADEAAQHPVTGLPPGPGAPEGAIGSLAVFWREDGREASEQDLAALRHLAANAGPAIENARRFREARKLADMDALTGLHNRRYFHDTLAREVARAHRYDRRLALVVFDIDDFKAINDRVGHLSGDAVLAQLAERVRSVVRSADIPCRVGGDEFAVILPESSLPDAEQLYRRLQFSVSTRPTGPADRLYLSAGIAELTPEDDAVSFFERADEALFRAKETGKGQAVAAEGA
jgi:diguanylate cyclase (GGDEF)-like protein